jgi:hypothetical protein
VFENCPWPRAFDLLLLNSYLHCNLLRPFIVLPPLHFLHSSLSPIFAFFFSLSHIFTSFFLRLRPECFFQQSSPFLSLKAAASRAKATLSSYSSRLEKSGKSPSHTQPETRKMIRVCSFLIARVFFVLLRSLGMRLNY